MLWKSSQWIPISAEILQTLEQSCHNPSFLAQHPTVQVRSFSLWMNTLSAHFGTATRYGSPSLNSGCKVGRLY